MRVVLSTLGRFHTFDLARELHAQGHLKALFTGYPRVKLRREALPRHLVRTFPWLHVPYMALRWRSRLGVRANRLWELADRAALDRYVSRHLPPCDVFVGLSGSALHTGRVARSIGARYVCDRGSTHIRTQDALLREEHEIWGEPYAGIDPRIIEREEQEYEASDCITVPSEFTRRSFVERGIPDAKVRRLPYGVNLAWFRPVGTPDPRRFDVLFVGGLSLRKGLPYLLQAFAGLDHPRKRLTIAGAPDARFLRVLRRKLPWSEHVRVLGHVPQHRLAALMSRSHVMVLPSIEEGLAMVQAQAMACGCPVIGTVNSGAEDLFTDGREGFIVPIRDSRAIQDRLQQLVDQPGLRERLGTAALERVRALGGWRDYGERAARTYQSLVVA